MRAKIKTMLTRDYEDMSRACAKLVKECLEEKPDSLLCFPAGSTAVRTFERLREMQAAGEVDFSEARFVALDEWLGLAPELEPEDCTHFMMKNLYGPLGVRPERLALFNVHAEDLTAECARIDRFILENGGIDLMLLGLGMNGHLGLNEPGSPFDEYTRVVELSETTKTVGQKYFSRPAVLTRGITVGIRHMFETKRVVLQVSGEHKQEIIDRLYRGGVTEAVPASVFRLLPGGLVVLDEAAAGKIRGELEELADLQPCKTE